MIKYSLDYSKGCNYGKEINQISFYYTGGGDILYSNVFVSLL